MIKINCDLCGKAVEKLDTTLIESVELDVCLECSKFGKVIAPVRRFGKEEFIRERIKQIQKPMPQEEKVELLVEDYQDIIKKKRESMGLSQKELAYRINEKESALRNIETGALEPQLSLTKKLEKALGLKLIEEYHEQHKKFKDKKEQGFTLGDFVNVKK